MKINYEYAQRPMSIEIEKKNGYFKIRHKQYSAGSSEGILSALLAVEYQARLNLKELKLFSNALIKRVSRKTQIAKNLFIIMHPDKYSMIYLRFPNALENVPLPRDISDKFAELVANEERS